MRTTKIIAFSVPPAFENQIQKHARQEHRTVSEYIREAVRQYMSLSRFDVTQRTAAKRMKRKGVKRSDVDEAIDQVRKRPR
jgi:Arc/MetJ-type ribon-helix-helix transcriptional regulator